MKFREDRLPFLYSLTIHAALLFLLAGGVPSCGGHGGKSDRDKAAEEQNKKGLEAEKTGSIIEKKSEVIQVELEEPKDGIGTEKPKPKFTKRDCGDKEWFGGIGVEIGVTADGQHIEFTKVHKNYPADKMGMQDGDWLASSSDYKNIRGKPGTDVTIQVIRNGELLTLTGVRERICTEPMGAQP